MGKAKRAKLNQSAKQPYAKQPKQPNKAQSSAKTSQKTPQANTKDAKSPGKIQASQQQPLPFGSADKILLIGEGDFSFAASLVKHHACTNITATTLESEEGLLAKYPQAAEHLETLRLRSQTVLFSIDATKLGLPHTAGQASLRKSSAFNVVAFNFPHIGGKSTDVNRQVRSNQELVVKFLEGAQRVSAPSAAIVVTIFEGQPYELWGLRNLARHVGLIVERSMRFEKDRYPGYHHARTLGNVETGWKGEDREARMYIFKKRGDQSSQKTMKKKSKMEESDDSDID